MALERIWIPSPCCHGRSQSQVRIIVLHTAEGARTIEDLGHYFQNYSNQVSSHAGADDKLGKIGEYVARGQASWTQANYNNAAISIELCGFASWSRKTWINTHHNMLENCARWIAEEAKHFGLPITQLSPSQAQGNGRGVCQHVDLGAGGGGHTDCGPGFPMDYVLDLARGSKPTEEMEEEMGQLILDESHRAALVFSNKQADGNHRLRFGCRDGVTLRVDFANVSETPTLVLSNGVPVGTDIPEGSKYAVVKVDDPTTGPTSPIAYVVSD